MVTVWLYTMDGRPAAFVYVQLPFPAMVTHGGRMYAWNADLRQYRECVPYEKGHTGLTAVPGMVEVKEAPEDERPEPQSNG